LLVIERSATIAAMIGPSSACRHCGFVNPRAWRACASCGRSLETAAHRTGRTVVGAGEATVVSASPEFEAQQGEFDPLATLPGESTDEILEGDLLDPADDEPPGETPLIGQADAAQALLTGIERAYTLGSPTLVALEGTRGSGKTRLMVYASEVAARIDPRVKVLYGACREGGDGPYAPFSRLLLERFGVTPSSSPSAVRAQMSTQVRSALGTADAIRVMETTHLLGHVAGIPFPASPILSSLESSPEELHRRGTEALARLIEGEAQSRPVLLLLDDVHYAEQPAWDLIRALTEVEGHVAIVLTGGEPLLEKAGKLEPEGGVAVGPIAPLSEQDVQSMLHVLLPTLTTAPEPLVSAVTHRSHGKPASVRELTFALYEAGIFIDTDGGLEVDLSRLSAEEDLPISMEDAIRARLARLDGLERATVERAAVVGEVFWDGAVLGQMRGDREPPGDGADPLTIWPDDEDQEALGQALGRLAEKGFVSEMEQSDIPGAREYVFAVEGTRALVYDQLEEDVRVRRHGAVARWLSLVAEVRREGVASMIAPHLERAGQTRRAGRAYLEAARYERGQLRRDRALRYVEQALKLIPEEDIVRRVDALHEHGSLLSTFGRYDEATVVFTEMLQLAWRTGAQGKGGAALNRIARNHRARGEDQRARELLDRALQLFRSASDLRGVAATLDDLAQIEVIHGEVEAAIAHASEALEIRRAHADERGEAVSLNTLGQLELKRGDLDTAESFFRAALEIRERVSDPEGALRSQNALGVIAYERGDRKGAVAAWRAALERARELADRRSECFLLNNVGEARLADGAYDEAEVALEQAQRLAVEIGDRRALADVLRNQAVLAVRRIDDDAESRLQEAMDAAGELGLPDAVAFVHRAFGEHRSKTLFDAAGQVDKAAEESFLTSIDLFREAGNEREAARSLVALGAHLVERGDQETARERLREARATFRHLGLEAEAAKVDQTLQQIGGG
jgi:tetratricopeptide (TPR) repeat protein